MQFDYANIQEENLMIIGVGLLLFSVIDGIPKLFAVKELKSKPEICKKEGMLSFPLETFKDSDGNYRGTINRLIGEEIGVSLEEVEIKKINHQYFHLIPNRNDIATVYGFGIYLGNPTAEFTPTDVDIAFEGWLTCGELVTRPLVRVEVLPIIRHFSKNGRL